MQSGVIFINKLLSVTLESHVTLFQSGFLLGIFFRGGKIYCYANFFCYAIVFGPNLREGQKFSGGANCLRGRPRPPLWKKASSYISLTRLRIYNKHYSIFVSSKLLFNFQATTLESCFTEKVMSSF